MINKDDIVVIGGTLLVIIVVALGVAGLVASEREVLMDECMKEGNSTNFECKAIIRQMTRVY